MAGQKIRIKLAAYDHELVDLAAQRIVDTMSKSRREDQRTHSAAHGKRSGYHSPLAP